MLFPVTDEVVERVADRLNGQECAYTKRSLYYAVCQSVESPNASLAAGQLGLGAVLILLAIILPWKPVEIALGIVGVLALGFGAYNRIRELGRPKGRALALSFPEFVERYCATPGDGSPLRFIDEEEWKPPTVREHETDVVLCDTQENCALLAANRKKIGDLPVTTVADYTAAPFGTRVFILHDANGTSSMLPSEIASTGVTTIDVAIHGEENLHLRLPIFEGAPRTLPPDAFDRLPMEEQLWLQSGKRCELACLPISAIAAMLKEAQELDAGESGKVLRLSRLPADVHF